MSESMTMEWIPIIQSKFSCQSVQYYCVIDVAPLMSVTCYPIYYLFHRFVNKFDVEHSCEEYYPMNETDSHGTACASIILAEGDNDVCSVGVAPGANLSACITTLNDTAFFIQHWEVVDISSNSWGPDVSTFIVSL